MRLLWLMVLRFWSANAQTASCAAVHSFDTNSSPIGALALEADGTLYSTTQHSAMNGHGSVFCLTANVPTRRPETLFIA